MIVRTVEVEWRLAVAPDEARARLVDALGGLGMQVRRDDGRLHASAARSWRRNRWAAEIEVGLRPADGGGTVAVCRVDMAGTKHTDIIDEIAEALGEDVFDDRGVGSAVAALGALGKDFGRKEIRHLGHLLHGDERVLVLGRGVHGARQGLIALTDRRLFFSERRPGSEFVAEFPLGSISSLEAAGGERLVIHAAGETSEIGRLFPGQADELARRFRQLTQGREPTPTSGGDDPLARLERLAALRTSGALTDDEFERLKRDIIGG